jgi:hypothetical protein
MPAKLTGVLVLAAALAGCAPRAAPEPPAPPQPSPPTTSQMLWVRASPDNTGFVLEPSGTPFRPWGFNYDHDPAGRLIEDYWVAEWPRVEADFAQMKRLGANVVRVHLQFAKFMTGPESPDPAALDRLGKLLGLAERQGLYLDLTGLGCYHKADVPAWYDALSEEGRWAAQARFWAAVAARCKDSPAVFCYDLMNEPVVPGGRRKDGDWLGPPFAGKHFVQFVTLDQKGRPRPQVARAWVTRLTAAARKEDPRHLVTVGLVDWSLDRPGLTSGFVPTEIAGELDFLAVHVPRGGEAGRRPGDAAGVRRRQAGGSRGDVPAEVLPGGSGGVHRPGRAARRRVDQLLLGQAAGGAAGGEDPRRRDPARLADPVPEAGRVTVSPLAASHPGFRPISLHPRYVFPVGCLVDSVRHMPTPCSQRAGLPSEGNT